MRQVRVREDEVFAEDVGGTLVLLDVRRSIFLELNAVAAIIFNALRDWTDNDALQSLLQATYPDVPADRISADIEGFLSGLDEHDLLVRRDSH